MSYVLKYAGYSTTTTTAVPAEQYRLAYSDYPGTAVGPPDPARWIGPPGPPGPAGPPGPPGTTSFAGLTGQATYAQLPAEVAMVPVTFVLSGKPATGAIANAPMAMAVTVPSGLVGTTVFDSTKATSNAAFTLNRIVNGTTVTPIGAVTITPASNTSATLTGTGGTLNAGDVLQLVSPVQDATLSDVGITLLCSRI